MKVLLVAGRSPWPPRRGDQLRSAQLLEVLAEQHEVTLLAPAGDHAQARHSGVVWRGFRPGSWAARVPAVVGCLARGLPAQCGLYLHGELAGQLRQLGPRHDLVILQLARLAPHVAQIPHTPLIVDLIDALSLSFATRARFDRVPWRPFLRSESRRLERAEQQLLRTAQKALLVSERDRRWLAERMPDLAAKLAVVPLEVAPHRRHGAPAPGEPPVVALTGNLGYFANRDAIGWWLDHVWPELSRRHPELHLRVAGDRPSAALRRRVARAGGRLEAHPEDLRAVLSRARVAVAPVRCGAGMPVKILEAWSVGVPVVASAWGAEGAGGRDGEELLVAGTPEKWVEQVERLLPESPLRRHLIRGASHRLAEHHGRAVLREALERAVAEAIGGSPAAPRASTG